MEGEFKLDGGWLAKLPPTVLLLVDVLVVDQMFWGGPILAILERWVLTKIPVIKDCLPGALITGMVASIAKREVATQFDGYKLVIKEKLDAAFRDAEVRLKENWEKNGEEKLQTIIGPLKLAASQTKNPAREKQLRDALASLKAILADQE